MSNPTVSVILPVFNGEDYLRFAIESVLNQTFQDLELIIIDDGSVDSTPSIAREYGERVRYVRQDNTGVAGAFNHGLRLAKGRYISWLSHDDVFMPTKLEKQIEAISRVTGPAVCYTDIQTINGQGKVVAERRLPERGPEEALRYVLTADLICSASYSILYDRRCIDDVGPYSLELRYAQDVDMLSRLARRFPLIHIPELLMQVREHGARAIRSKNWEREVTSYFTEKLNATPLEELFPDIKTVTRSERAAAYLWMADRLAGLPIPVYQKLALGQYRNALAENRAILPKLMGHYVWTLFGAFRVGTKAVLAQPEVLMSLIKSRD